MSLATFKDLCMDATDSGLLGEFWSTALGLELHRQDNGDAFLTGPSAAHTIWINQVPEPKTVKHRIHLDVHGSAVGALRAGGATIVDDESFHWIVMADPEGGEFCLFLRDEQPDYRLYEVVVDCADHEAMSAWWVEAIGGQRRLDERGFSYLVHVPGAPFDSLTFLPVDETKQTKNRIHLDLFADDPAMLVDVGATLLRRRDDEIDWEVLADPEGNEFCVFAPT